MVTVEEAIELWRLVDSTKCKSDQGLHFHSLLAEKVPGVKLPAKVTRLRS